MRPASPVGCSCAVTGPATWMEIYEDVADPAGFEREIADALVRHGVARLAGRRRPPRRNLRRGGLGRPTPCASSSSRSMPIRVMRWWSRPIATNSTRGKRFPRIGVTSHRIRDVLAGRDLMAGGTWMGVRRDGRWALVTNVRKGRRQQSGSAVARRTRAGDPERRRRAGGRAGRAPCQRGNLQRVQHAGRRSGTARRGCPIACRIRTILTQGVHGLSNARLDTPWPKLTRTKAALSSWAARGDDCPVSAVRGARRSDAGAR